MDVLTGSVSGADRCGHHCSMSKKAETEDVQRLLADGAQVVEVLPRSHFEREHLPGAGNIPLAELVERQDELDRDRPVVVYCYDHQCDLSARAAAVLDTLGFSEVYDYVDSKAAWFGSGLPAEGSVDPATRAGAIARPVPTVGLGASTTALRERFGDDGVVVVVDDDNVVLGLVHTEALDESPHADLLDLIRWAPPTVRPSITASELDASMRKDERRYVLVSRLDGTLLGIIVPADLEGAG